MKIKLVYSLLAISLLASCVSQKRVRRFSDKTYDAKGKLVKERKHYLYRDDDNRRQRSDTDCYEYFYNNDNTLDYCVKRWKCDSALGGYISKFRYRFEVEKQQLHISVIFYEQCSDYPFKIIDIYNTKGQLLEERVWEMPNYAIPDTLCIFNGVWKETDYFDTASYKRSQTLLEKRTYSYSKRGKLPYITLTRYHVHTNYSTIPSTYELDEEEGRYKKPGEDMPVHYQFYEYLTNHDEFTVVPYLRSIVKLEK